MAIGEKGYLWRAKITSTDPEVGTYYATVITSSKTPTAENKYGYAELDPTWGDYNLYDVQCGDFQQIICGLTVDEISEITQIDYNKGSNMLTGNVIVIESRYNNADSYWENMVIKASDDFVPNSTGAKYIFRGPDGEQQFIVGQQYDTRTFEGNFSFVMGTNPPECTARPYGSCNISGTRGQYYVWCEIG